jgi:Tfp pilus assembly protein PilO
MKRSDLTILLSVLTVGLLAAFWLLFLSPKRQEAADLSDQVTQLETSVEQQEQLAAYARQAEDAFPSNYHRLVVLGKGVPADSDTPSLLIQVQHLADQAKVDFRAIELSGASGVAAEAPPTTPPPLVAPGTDTSGESVPAESATPAPAPTEATAALLPLGASIGPAGLATMPYELEFKGGYFEIADFLGELAGLVHPKSDGVRLRGRLLTVDGFSLGPDSDKGFPNLEANLTITTYVTPAGQGLTAGATPTGPAPATSSTPTPAATSSTPTTTTPAATTTP